MWDALDDRPPPRAALFVPDDDGEDEDMWDAVREAEAVGARPAVDASAAAAVDDDWEDMYL